MEKKVLKLRDIIQMEAELNGYVNQQTGEKVFQGILSQKLPLATKYWLTDLSGKLKKEVDAMSALRDELVKKLGAEKDGMIQIERIVKDEDGNDVINPALIEFEKEYGGLLEQEKEVEFKSIKLSEIANIETSETYPVLFSVLDAE